MHSFKELADLILKNIPGYIPVVFFSALGGFVRVLNTSERPSLRRLFVEIITSGFVGVMVFFLLSEFNLGGNIIAATCGISGYCSKTILDILSRKVISKIEDVNLFGKDLGVENTKSTEDDLEK